MHYPEIKIRYAQFLDPIFVGWIRSQEKYREWTFPTKDVVIARVKNYKRVWNKYSESILVELTRATGMTFVRSMIPVYIVSGNPRAFSDPVVLKSGYSDADFVHTLTHELIHCLFVDNGIPVKEVHKLFPHADLTTSAHIPVYALMKHVFGAIGRPDIYTIELEESTTNLPYRAAREIVDSEDYERLIAMVKDTVTIHIGTLN